MTDLRPRAAEPSDTRPSFRVRVLSLVASIPEGRVLSYGGAAVLAGNPRAARGVGSVLSAHGDGVPWWRVVNASGRISPRPTARLQRTLLEAEGVGFRDDRIDFDRFAWVPNSGEGRRSIPW